MQSKSENARKGNQSAQTTHENHIKQSPWVTPFVQIDDFHIININNITLLKLRQEDNCYILTICYMDGQQISLTYPSNEERRHVLNKIVTPKFMYYIDNGISES